MRPDEQAAIAAVNAAQHVLAGAGHDLDPLTIAVALVAADTAASEYPHTLVPVEVQLIGRVDGPGASAAMAHATAAILATAADTYLRDAGAGNYVEQHVTGRDGTRYVITFHHPDGHSPDELLTTTQTTLDRLTAAILHLADRLDTRAHDTRVLSVRGTLRDVSASLRNLLLLDRK